MKLNVLLITTQASVLLSGGDYFMENFDETKNCKRENKMKEMQKNKRENCAENRFGIFFFSFSVAKATLITIFTTNFTTTLTTLTLSTNLTIILFHQNHHSHLYHTTHHRLL